MRKSLLLFLLPAQLCFAQQRIILSENLTPSNALPQRSVEKSSTNDLVLTYRFPEATIHEMERGNMKFQILSIKGFGLTKEVGYPALPAHNDVILLKSSQTPEIEIISAEYKEYDNYVIFPAQPKARDTYGATAPPFTLNKDAYAQDKFYPEFPVQCSEILLSRGNPLGVIELVAAQYNPVKKKLRVYTSIRYKIIDKEPYAERQSTNTNSENYNTLLKSNVINYWDVPTQKLETEREIKTGVNYLIVTHSAYKQAADSLAHWKNQMGYTTEVIVKDSWTSVEVMEAVQSRYNSWEIKPDYLTIIGDHDGQYAVPGKLLPTPQNETVFATDLYYCCFDGSYDYYPDMAHGRISVASPQQALSVVQKIINYERNPVNLPDFYSHGTNCAQFQDIEETGETPDGYAARRFCHTSENIRDYLKNIQGYDINRIYQTDKVNNPTNFNNGYYSNGEAIPDELLKSNGFAWDGDANDIKQNIDEGRFYLFHRDHGYSGGIGWSSPQFLSNGAQYGSDIAKLKNGNRLPVVFSINCHTGEFKLKECFAEEFLRKDNGGAVGVVAASYYSYSGFNDAFSIGMVDAIWPKPGLTAQFGYGGIYNPPVSTAKGTNVMGDVMNQGLHRMVETWYTSRYTYELFHWFGDAAMRIWIEDPYANPFELAHNGMVNCDDTIFTLTGNTGYGMATLMSGDIVLGKAEMVSTTLVEIPYKIAESLDTVILTLTGTNRLPYIKVLPVSQTCIFKPTVLTGETINESDESVTLSGLVIKENNSEISTCGFLFSTDGLMDISNPNNLKIELSYNGAQLETTINDLDPGTTYPYVFWAINDQGISYGKWRNAVTLCSPKITDFPHTITKADEGLSFCWSSIDNNGKGFVWSNASKKNRKFMSSSAEDGFMLFDSDSYGAASKYNSDLISHVYDFSGQSLVWLNFEHAYKRYNKEDSVELSISINGGTTWKSLKKWDKSAGTLEVPDFFHMDISSSAANQNNVRFKWNFTGGWCYYWCIDNINVGPEPIINSVADRFSSNGISMFPNPTNGDVYLSFEQAPVNAEVKITNLAGKVIHAFSTSEATTRIETTNFAKGIYLIQITLNGTTMVEKLSIQ